jgi:hypothetical protein
MKKAIITHSEENKIENSAVRIEGEMQYDQGSEGALMQFSLICKNLPIGTIVGFYSNTPGPVPPIELPPTTVSYYPSFVVGMESQVPANYQCILTYYADFKQAPPANASIQLQAAYIVNGD